MSNFDTADLRGLAALPGGGRCAVNQVYHSLSTRGAEFDLLPWQRERQMPLMAYCPLDQGDLVADATLRRVAGRIGGVRRIALPYLRERYLSVAPRRVG